jgi:hypothetical protein
MQPCAPFHLAALERANDDQRRATAIRRPGAQSTSREHHRQRRRVLESLFRIPNPEQR